MKTRAVHASIVGLLAITLTACSFSPTSTSSPSPLNSANPPQKPTATLEVTPAPAEPQRTEATLIAVGDIMVHMPQLPAYYDKNNDRYNFTPWFSQVKPLIQQGDWVIGNLETPLAGKDLKYTGYPRFNAPAELADALVDAGVNVLSTANNHSMDRGVPGIERTLSTLRAVGIVPVGTASTLEEQQELVIVEKNGIRMGFLSYTYGTNGIPVPTDKAFTVNLIDLPTIKEDIARLKQADADLITVSLHFGQEYQRLPNESQTLLAYEIVKAGGDIILGSHPHVVQPYEEINITASESADGIPHRGIVIYSLGNFISNQTGDWKDIGLIFGLHIVKTSYSDGSTSTTWNTLTTEATWVHILRKNQQRYYTIIPMSMALTSKDIPGLTENDYSTMKTYLHGINKHLLSLQPK